MLWRKSNTVREREVSIVRREQDGSFALVTQQQIPPVLVPPEDLEKHSRPLHGRVPLARQNAWLCQPVHVRDPGSSGDMHPRHHEVACRHGWVGGDRHHDEVLSLVHRPLLRLWTEGPADGPHARPPCALDLNLDESAVIAFGQYGKDVRALQAVTCQSWRPTPTRQLCRNVMFSDGLRLLSVCHDAESSGGSGGPSFSVGLESPRRSSRPLGCPCLPLRGNRLDRCKTSALRDRRLAMRSRLCRTWPFDLNWGWFR